MVNGENSMTVLPRELETLKQELLSEIRNDLQQVKVDILTGEAHSIIHVLYIHMYHESIYIAYLSFVLERAQNNFLLA